MINLKQIAICILISVLLPMTIFVSIDYVFGDYRRPEKLVASQEAIADLQRNKTELEDLANSLKNQSGEVDKADLEKYNDIKKRIFLINKELYLKTSEHTNLLHKYSKDESNFWTRTGYIKFWVYLIIGFISILAGFFLPRPGLNSGLIIGGLVLITLAYGAGWNSITPILKSISLIILLLSVLLIALFRSKQD